MAQAGEEVEFELRAFDAAGNPLGTQQGASWLLEGLTGTVDDNGVLRPAEGQNQAGEQ